MQQLFIGNCDQKNALNWAKKQNIPYLVANFGRYHCGEQYLQCGEPVGTIHKQVSIIHTLAFNPAENLIQLALIADLLLNNGAVELSLIMPHMAYARQDKIPQTTLNCAALAGRAVLKMIAAMGFARFAIFDHHNPDFLATQVPGAINIPATHLIAAQIRKQNANSAQPKHLVLIAPDKGGAIRIAQLGALLDCATVNLTKQRSPENSANNLRIELGELAAQQLEKQAQISRSQGQPMHCIIVDDIVDSGTTLASAIDLLKREISHASLEVYVTHAVGSFATLGKLVAAHPEVAQWNFSNSNLSTAPDPLAIPAFHPKIKRFDMIHFALDALSDILKTI